MAVITAAMVKELRVKTDAPMMECKKALTEADGNMEQAEEILRVKLGNKATKAASRITADGVVAIYIDEPGKIGAIVELNSETDFVAKNADFIAFANDIAKLVAENKPADVAALSALPLNGSTVDEVRKGLIGKIGENQGAGELASVEDAKAFVAAGVDKLACGICNIHGVYPEGWSGLNFDRLKEIAEAVPETPLVLHGGSGIPQDQIEKAISLGISKININTEFQLAFQEATRKYIEEGKDQDKSKKGYDPRKLLLPGTEAITDSMKEMISWMGTPSIDDKEADASFDRSSLNEV